MTSSRWGTKQAKLICKKGGALGHNDKKRAQNHVLSQGNVLFRDQGAGYMDELSLGKFSVA